MNRLERYSDYLHGSHWRELKITCYRQRGVKCEACSSRVHIEAHHLIYRAPLESCTPSDIMLLCAICHGQIHADKSLDAFLKSASETPTEVRRRIVTDFLARRNGGKKSFDKRRAQREKSHAEEREALDARQPLRECRRPFKRWKDYVPEAFPQR